MKAIQLYFTILLLFIYFFPLQAEDQQIQSEGYWIYGFEQSVFETCDGQLYWIWVDLGFKGKYAPEGYRNPVIIHGLLLPPNPDENMYSPLPEIKILQIQNIRETCK
jgi:hypothetical protein